MNLNKIGMSVLLIAMTGLAEISAVYAADAAATIDAQGMKSTSDALELNNADIRDVLRLLAEMYDLNIVMSDEVRGVVTMKLKGTSLANTLDALLTIRGYDYEIRDNIVRVASAGVIENERTQRQARQQLEPLISEVITLQYLDANDVKPMVSSIISERGSVTVLERRSFSGFQFGATAQSSSQSSSSSSSSTTPGNFSGLLGGRADNTSRSNTLMVVDVRRQIDRIKEMIERIDIAPKQVLIDARIVEVNAEALDDLGVDFSGNTSLTVSGNKSNTLRTAVNSGSLSSSVSDLGISNTTPSIDTDAGFHAYFERLNGEDFDVTFHAILQDERTKVLSSPRILTIENQEAAILVGEQFPIFEANVTDSGTTTETLSYFQPIGISLQVIAQITPKNDISMIIHPTISSVGGFVTGTSGLTQPRINVREADTRVIIKDGETLVIGGLLEDSREERYWRVPILGHIPLFSGIFSRKQAEVDQRNLLIFITPNVVDKEAKFDSKAYTQNQIAEVHSAYWYALPKERKKLAAETMKAAKVNMDNQKYLLAEAQLKKVMDLEPGHPKAQEYLQKIKVLKTH